MDMRSDPDINVLDYSHHGLSAHYEGVNGLNLIDDATRVHEKLTELKANCENLSRELTERKANCEDCREELDGAKNQLSAANHEVKEMRSQDSQQISMLESEVVKMSKRLETNKALYNKLEQLYANQCRDTKKYQIDLRDREEILRTLRVAHGLIGVEVARYAREHVAHENCIAVLKSKLKIMQSASMQLVKQKQANVLLREIIEHLRVDTEMCNDTAGVATRSGRTTGLRISPQADNCADARDIMTRTEMIANPMTKIEAQSFEEVKKYPEIASQASLFFSSQWEPILIDLEIETRTAPSAGLEESVELLPVAHTMIQMPSKEVHGESMSTSPSKPADTPLEKPPAYKQLLSSSSEQEEHEWHVTVSTVKKYHPCKDVEEPGPTSVSLDALEHWRTLKAELGVSCLVIDKILAGSSTNSVSADRLETTASRWGSLCIKPVLWVGGTVFLLMMLGQMCAAPYHGVPDGPTAHDRSMWNSFNCMGKTGPGAGIAGRARGGSEEVSNFIEWFSGGEAKVIRGWPT
ncbi:hypothetical protein C8R43DRAFT_1131204 [Mycena crocata]|nr:hypothetical protein C8R43DRAFT_1131204 [Mycena crocata]